ncbi:MAG: hypothetical protein AB1Z67_14285 [Candidatus Limnocylindrales bacterium]
MAITQDPEGHLLGAHARTGRWRYVAGKWDGSFVPRKPPATDEGAAVDYRIIDGSGSDASLGRLYAYDAANAGIVGLSRPRKCRCGAPLTNLFRWSALAKRRTGLASTTMSIDRSSA